MLIGSIFAIDFSVDAACPFIYQFKLVSDNEESKINSFYIVPKIGLGYRF